MENKIETLKVRLRDAFAYVKCLQKGDDRSLSSSSEEEDVLIDCRSAWREILYEFETIEWVMDEQSVMSTSKIPALKSEISLRLQQQGHPNTVNTDGSTLLGKAIRQPSGSVYGLNTSLRLVKLLVYYGADVSLPAFKYEHRDIHALELFLTFHKPYISRRNSQEIMELLSCPTAFRSLPKSPWVAFNVEQCCLEYILKVGLLFYAPGAFTLKDFIEKFPRNAPKAAFSDWLVDLSPSDLSRSNLPHEESIYFTLQTSTFSLRHLARRAIRRRLFSRRNGLPNTEQMNEEQKMLTGLNVF